MSPTRLDHSDFRISKKLNSAPEQVWLWDKIGVENTDKITFGRHEAGSESTGFETGAIDAMNELNVEAAPAQFVRAGRSQLPRIIGRIIQHLNLKKLPRVVQFADGAKQALDHVNFVKDRQLHRHLRQLFKSPGRDGFTVPVFEKQVDYEVAMDSVGRKTNEHAQVADRPDNVSEASLHVAFRSCPLVEAARAT